jgi:group I intron endonuclease
MEPQIGIYKITNPKGKIYIGQSINLPEMKKHYERLAVKKQPKIYNSLKKYGWDSHLFEVIEECDLDIMDDREVFWKQYFLQTFNDDWDMVLFCELYDGGGGPKSTQTKEKISKANIGKILSQETRDKIKNSPNRRENIGNSKRGKPFPSARDANMGNTYRKGKKMSDESKEKIGKGNRGKKRTPEVIESLRGPRGNKHSPEAIEQKKQSLYKTILQFSLDGEFIKEWKGIKIASSELNISYTGITNCIKGKYKTCGSFIWKLKK